ncbi:MAG: ABC transporter ATP-binding protein [Nocardioidaceae bacterium]
MTSAEAGLRAEGIHAGYDGHRHAVLDASLTVTHGEVTALIGPNGSGKSTLLRTVARLHPLASGTVRLGDGTETRTLSAKAFARRVTLLTQHRPTPGSLTVLDVVGFGRHPYRGRWREADPEGAARIAWCLEVTGVEEMADRPVDQLSGGELQRVWLATCLAQDTDVLLLDEPTNHLDLRYQVEMLDLVRDLATAHRVAVGVVLHDLNHAAGVADRLVLLREGTVFASGRPVDVLTSDLLTEAYGIDVEVARDPVTGLLSTRPIGRHSARLATA